MLLALNSSLEWALDKWYPLCQLWDGAPQNQSDDPDKQQRLKAFLFSQK